MNRQKQWKTIWDKKYNVYQGHENLHVADGYDGLSYEQWQKLTRHFIDRIGFRETDNVLEVGCGSGAFLNEIGPVGSISGTDFADKAINRIQKEISGNFHVAEASVIPFDDNSFDVVLSFGVFVYFADLVYASDVIHEMLRVLKPGGTLFIGEINDLAKKDVAMEMRRRTETDRDKHRVSSDKVDHLYYPTQFFKDIAMKSNFDFELIEHDNPELSFCYNAPYRFSVILRDKGGV